MLRDAITNLFSSGSGGGGGGPGSEEAMVVGQYWTLFLDRLGATSTEIGLIRSINSAVNMLLAAPFGWLTDRTQKRRECTFMVSYYICQRDCYGTLQKHGLSASLLESLKPSQ